MLETIRIEFWRLCVLAELGYRWGKIHHIERNSSRDLLIVSYESEGDFVDQHGTMGGRRIRVLDNWYYPHTIKMGGCVSYTRGNRTAIAISKSRPFGPEVLSEIARTAFSLNVTATDVLISSIHDM